MKNYAQPVSYKYFIRKQIKISQQAQTCERSSGIVEKTYGRENKTTRANICKIIFVPKQHDQFVRIRNEQSAGGGGALLGPRRAPSLHAVPSVHRTLIDTLKYVMAHKSIDSGEPFHFSNNIL